MSKLFLAKAGFQKKSAGSSPNHLNPVCCCSTLCSSVQYINRQHAVWVSEGGLQSNFLCILTFSFHILFTSDIVLILDSFPDTRVCTHDFTHNPPTWTLVIDHLNLLWDRCTMHLWLAIVNNHATLDSDVVISSHPESPWPWTPSAGMDTAFN